MVIIIVSFTSVSVIVTTMFVDYTSETKKHVVSKCSEAISEYMRRDCVIRTRHEFNRATRNEFHSIKSFIKLVSPIAEELLVMITDDEGTIRMRDTTSTSYGHITDSIPKDIMEDIKGSEGLIEIELSHVLKNSYYSCAVPYYGANGEFLGAVIVCSSSEAMGEMVEMLVKTIILTSLWVVVIALVAVYIVSERNVAPIKNMSQMAKKFASGDFENRVPVKGKDEIAQLAVAFNNMAQQLAVLEDTRKSFLANVAHDLRTPMTTISGFVDNILAGAVPPEKQEEYLRLISDEIKRLSRLVGLLLDISRIQSGDRKFNFTDFDICEMARMILISFEAKLEEKQLDVEFDCERDNLYAYADKDAIHQVLYNICHNAIKFSKQGAKYRIKLSRMDKKIYVSVYNEGIGMTEDELHNVFERFFKSDKSRGLDKTGVGLGMYITKTIIDAHEQEIWVKSVFGEYCEFVFTLKEGEGKKTRRAPRLTDEA